MLTPRRTWPVWLGSFAAADFAVNVSHHQPVAMELGALVAVTLEPTLGAFLIGESLRRWRGYRARTVAFVVFGVAVAPLVGATIGASATVLLDAHAPGWWTVAGTWWLGDALGVIVVGSTVLAWARWRVHSRRSVMTSPPAIAALAAAAAGVVMGSAVLWHDPAVLAVLPLLVWAAFAGGPLAVTGIGTAVAGAADWAAITGRTNRLLASASPAHQLAVLQAYLGVTLLTVLVLAAEVAERRRGEHLTRKAELERARTEQAAVKVAEAERHSISQDTHDIVGHGLASVLLQLGAARQVLRCDPDQANALLVSAEAVGRRACQDLEIALASMGHQPLSKPGRGLAELPVLIDALSQAGLRVTLDNEADGTPVPTLVDWSAYRIVQEALTNVARHAPGAKAWVTVRADRHELVLSVVDDGGAERRRVTHDEGRGIAGMRERATALGGTLEAFPREGRGFAVVAKLPW
jgi:signal transduction histidine kinase